MTQDPYRYFRVEARELLEQLSRGVMDLEKGVPAPDLVSRLLRLAHTLKGAARVVKQVEIAETAHAVEDSLAPLRGQDGPAPSGLVNRLLGLLDSIGGRVSALEPAAGGGGKEAEAATASHAPPEESFRTVRADITEMDALLDGISAAGVELGPLRRAAGAAEKARHLADLIGEQVTSPRALSEQRAGGGAASTKVRSLAEELRGVVTGLERGLAAGVERIEREMVQARAAAERLRLLPADLLFASLERTARDAAHAVGKRVGFEAKGGDVRLDAHVLAGVQAALVQGVRNAVAHGIEEEAERAAAGKPAGGRVAVEVVRRGNRALFQVRDDGRGVDIEAVRRVVQARGLPAAEAQRLGAEELLRILLEGGLTTSGAVTEVSGRGVGLDVVREAAERLGGDVALRTAAGRGATLELVVPVSLSSLDALLVESAGVTAALPLDAVRGASRIRRDEVALTPAGGSVLHGGKAVPLIALADLLGLDGEPARVPRSWSAVILDGGAGAVAVGVDRLLGIENVVLRPLPSQAPVEPIVAGASFDAEGNPQMLLDPEELLAAALRERPAASSAGGAPRPPVLVVDDSLTTRMLEQSILESAGYEVDLAVSAEEALKKARQRRYGIYLVDVEMPGMDGFAFVEQTRADPALREVPAILVTSRGSQDDRRRGVEAGASAYIVKSEFDQAELLETIRRLVE